MEDASTIPRSHDDRSLRARVQALLTWRGAPADDERARLVLARAADAGGIGPAARAVAREAEGADATFAATTDGAENSDAQAPPLTPRQARYYLLGALSPSRAAAVEDAYLADPERFAVITAAEEALLADYASGRLDPAERERLSARRLYVPAWRARLGGVAGPKRDRVAAGVRALAILSAAGVVATGVLWMFAKAGPPKEDIVLSLTTTAQATPGDNIPRVTLPARVDDLELRISVGDPAPYAMYIAVFRRGPDAVLHKEALHPSGGVVRLFVPPDLAPPGRYEVALYGLAEEGAVYALDVFPLAFDPPTPVP